MTIPVLMANLETPHTEIPSFYEISAHKVKVTAHDEEVHGMTKYHHIMKKYQHVKVSAC